jgi:S1-C subfamily serine protease
MDTAASTTGPTRGFAIPINRALPVVHQIVSGVRTSSIHIGYPGFLAITMAPGTDRPEILQVIAGGPADRAGLTTGDVITAVNGTAVRTQLGLRAAIGSHSPGSRVSLTYRDPTGAAHTAQVTLAKGPAD